LLICFFVGGIALASHTSINSLVNSAESYIEEDMAEEMLFRFSEEELDFFDEEITRILVNNRFNGSVLIARYGTVLYHRTLGFADFRNHIPLTPNTPFQLASISKTFTGAAVLLLQEEGKLNIDDPIKDHIPTFPYDAITVRHLLNHTSGLQNYMWLVERFWKNPLPPTNENVLDLFIKHQRPLDFTPGTRFAYSNTGYAFLGLLIERVSGQRYPDFVRERIFQPLAMENTFVYDLHAGAVPSERAFGFRQTTRAMVVIPDVAHDGVFGDKGIYSTTSDLYKWDQAIYLNALLPADVWQQAFQPAVLRNNNTIEYGHGWRLQTYLDRRIAHHPGRWNGFRTSFKRFIDDHATLILLNNTNRDITGLIRDIQKTIFHEEIHMIPLDQMVDEGEEYGGSS
jgi:CubicO group peptidase (beta-lactamase class C family)